MKHLIIKNLGPINTVEMEMKRVNLIIGPQSSGKSTVLKVACYCTWVEKRVSIEQNPERFAEPGIFEKNLVSFHKLEGFMQYDTYIEYESDIVKFAFSKEEEKFEFEWKNRWDYQKSKVSYIPAERNIVAAIPNWFEVNMPNNNIRNFMADWEMARRNFKDEVQLDILNLGVSYFYDTKSKEDKVRVAEGKLLNFTNASSGLQSLIPLYVFLKYFTEQFFLKEEDENSVMGGEINKHLAEVISSEVFPAVGYRLFEMPSPLQVLAMFKSKEEADRFSALFNNFTKVGCCNVFLEEPEENLFPLTQHELVNALVGMINGDRKHNLFITTHSPYIMASFNNLLQAGDVLVKNATKKEALGKIIPLFLALDYNEVSAYTIKEGTMHTIMDDEMKLISPTELDAVSDEISVQFGKLLEL